MSEAVQKQIMTDRVKELAKVLVLWNRMEIGPDVALDRVWKLFKKEALEQWNGDIAPNWCRGDSS